MGSGMGLSFPAGAAPLDVAALGAAVTEKIAAFRRQNPGVRVMIETGRYVVGGSGIYATKVLDRKISYGKTFIILKNTLNGFLRPSLAKLAERCAAPLPPVEPLFTRGGAFPFYAAKEAPAEEIVTLAGNLCTAADIVAEDVLMPHLARGDVLFTTNAGAYGAALSPMQFSAQERPAELFLTDGGAIVS